MKKRTFRWMVGRGRGQGILHGRMIPSAMVSAAALALLLVTSATAQPAKAPAAAAPKESEGFKNLQILPKDISDEQLHDTMRGFAGALGVRCLECHVGDETKPMQTWNWASDDKPEKVTARVMMKMTADLNGKWITQVKSDEGEHVQVTCATCHHGKTKPRSLQDVLTKTMNEKGVDGAVARYRELHDKYYGRDAFDFGDQPLNQMAEKLANDKKTDDALKLLALNAEMNPKSARVQMMIGEAQMAAGAKDKAIEAYQKAVDLDPKNERVKSRLAALQSGAAK